MVDAGWGVSLLSGGRGGVRDQSEGEDRATKIFPQRPSYLYLSSSVDGS